MELETVSREQQEKLELVQRVADSPPFRNAPRLREFLLFVTERALSDRAHEISELSLGHRVFHKPEHYDTTNDNIVRVSARQVRVKLKEYAEQHGGGDAWVLEMPKGGYVPVFTRRGEVAVVETPTPLPVVAAVAPDRTRFWKLLVLGLVVVVLGLGAALVRNWAAVPVRRSAPLTDLIVRPGQRTLLVVTDSSLVLLHELTGQMMNVHEYEARQYPQSLQADLQGVARHLVGLRLMSLADITLAMGLVRARPDAEDRIQVVHARDMGPRNLKDNNVILLGGSRSNPWAGLFEDRLNFRFAFTDGGTPPRIVNTKPQAGEPAAYESDGAARAFARFALVPNLNHTGRVMLLSGTTIEATEAASEFFLDAHADQTLRAALGREPEEGNGFEVVLETSSIGGTARNARIVAWRAVP